MPNGEMTTEEFIYQPDTIALILESSAAARDLIEENPDSQTRMGKALYGGYRVLYVNQNESGRILSDAENYSSNPFPLVLGLLGLPELEASGISRVQQQPFLNLRGGGVLLGFVDTGIDYTKSAFTYEDKTSKIRYIWDQTIRGKAPEGYFYGSEYSNEEINRALQSATPFDVVPHRDTVGHGTFLASVAGSREEGDYLGAAPDAEIIMVKLRRARPFDYSRYLVPRRQQNAFSSDDFMLGVQYILDKAQELERPVALCVSLGTNLGGHDGFNLLGQYMTEICEIEGACVCCAAGNEAQAGHHTQDRLLETGGTKDIELLASESQEDIYLTLWNNASDRLSVAVRSPTGEQVNRVPARSGTHFENKLILERSTVIVEYRFPVESSGAQFTRIKILAATPGVWTITVYGDSVLDGTFHAWLPMTGFIDPKTAFLKPVPNYTVTSPATSLGLIACGAYNSETNVLEPSSSWGPTRLPANRPDLVAPGGSVRGIYPTGNGEMSGTSAAAAITAGAGALMLQWGIVEKNNVAMDSYRIRASLIAGCDRDKNLEYPNNQWGYGKLNLFNTFRALRTY